MSLGDDFIQFSTNYDDDDFLNNYGDLNNDFGNVLDWKDIEQPQQQPQIPQIQHHHIQQIQQQQQQIQQPQQQQQPQIQQPEQKQERKERKRRHRNLQLLEDLRQYGLVVKDDQGYNPDSRLDRLQNHHVFIDGKQRTFETRKYLNRHLVIPEDWTRDAYYQIDDVAKNIEYRNAWVQVIGSKWLPSSRKIIWRCRNIQTGQIIYSLYIDGTSRRLATEQATQDWIDDQKTNFIISLEDRTKWIKKLKTVLEALETFQI